MKEQKRAILERNFQLYWNGEEPEITDERFDQLVQELRKDNPKDPLLSKLGVDIPRGQEYRHVKPMLSLDKVYAWKDLQSWIRKVSRTENEKFIIQFKFDGLAGKMEGLSLATRGNGVVGENISRRKPDIQLIRGDARIPLVKVDAVAPILGELVVSFEDFARFRVTDEKEYAHPRNFVAGMVNRKQDLPPGVRLDFVEYVSSPQRKLVAKAFTEERWKGIVDWFNSIRKYPTDGLVVKLADQEYANSLGFTEHHPLGAIAFKFYGATVWAKLVDVIWQAGKDCLSPVGILRPVELGGVTISRVTLHNADIVEQLNIHIGDDVEIERAGEVIPHVLNRKSGQWSKPAIPNNCPICGSVVARRGTDLICTNPECVGMKFQRLMASLELFEIDGLGEKTVRQLWEDGRLESPADIFKVPSDVLGQLTGFSSYSGDKLWSSIHSVKFLDEATVLATTNTPGVGKSMYEKILKRTDFETLLHATSEDWLAMFPDVGSKRAAAIIETIQASQDYIQDLLRYVAIRKTVAKETKTVCFTGKMDKPRKFYQDEAKKHGWRPVDGVAKDLTLLVTTEIDRASSKMTAAKKQGVKIVTMEQWKKEIDNV